MDGNELILNTGVKKELVRLLVTRNSSEQIQNMMRKVEAYDLNHQRMLKEIQQLNYELAEKDAIIIEIKKMLERFA